MIALANFELWALTLQVNLKTQQTVGNRLKDREVCVCKEVCQGVQK